MVADRGAEDDLRSGLDGLTYVEVEFSHPEQPHRTAVVRALVDTGASDCDLKQSVIDSLGLPATKEGSYFETAAGRHVHSRAFRARVRVKGFEGIHADVRLNPSDEDEEDDSDSESKSMASTDDEDVDRALGFGTSTDDAVLGHWALAQLGLLVDCAGRRLRTRDASLERVPSVSFTRTGMHVPLEIANPNAPDRAMVVHALVDSGSTDLDLDAARLAHLGLPVDPDEAPAQFETAGGVTIEAPVFRAEVRALGRRASVRVSPSEDPCSAGGSDSDGACSPSEDEALLGHDALAAMGLLVDCGRGLLLADPSGRPPPPGTVADEPASAAAGSPAARSPAAKGM